MYDRVEYKYNRLGDVIAVKDQNETVHEFDYDDFGRRNADRVTAFGSNIDQSIKRIATGFDDHGRVESVTSYDHLTIDTDHVVNQVALSYNGRGQLTIDAQAHGDEVITGTPQVEYLYADGSANHVRPTGITYPNGRAIDYQYGNSTSHADYLSRVSSLYCESHGDAVTMSQSYQYLGLGQIVQSTANGPLLRMNLCHGTGDDIYDGPLDRFGRVTDLRWDINNSLVEHLKHGYDLAGNRLWRDNEAAANQSTARWYDEFYNYDKLYQLKATARGQLEGTPPYAITSHNRKLRQEWTFDNTGNWTAFKEDNDGNGFWNLEQTRSHNKANETGTIAASTGTNWADPVHDAAGNMTTIPKPTSLANGYTCKYDAWNRLIEVKECSTVIATNAYDGLNRRTKRVTSAETRHFYYSPSWQVIEERIGSSTLPERQFIWGLRYVDDLVMRERDTSGTPDGVMDERIWAIQDANFNVTALVLDGTDPAVIERLVYHPYGAVTVFEPDYSATIASSNFEIRFAGYRWDDAVNMYHVRHRWLHSQLGRWANRDPLGYGRSYHLYSYVGNRAVSTADPAGLDPGVTFDLNKGELVIDDELKWNPDANIPLTHEVDIVAKSFIASVTQDSIGYLGAFGGTEKLHSLWQKVKDLPPFNENPRTDDKGDMHYRLYSHAKFEVCCAGDSLESVRLGEFDNYGGREGPDGDRGYYFGVWGTIRSSRVQITPNGKRLRECDGSHGDARTRL